MSHVKFFSAFCFSVLTAGNVFGAGAAGLSCPSNVVLDGGPADAVLGAGGYLQCDDTPDAMVIEFYKLGLCKTKPTYDDYGDCEFLFDNSAGKTTTLSVGLSDSLVDEISISEGEYPYAMLVISNSLGLKNKVVFDNAIWSMDGGVGRYCVTNSNDHTFAPTDFSDGNYTCHTDSTVQPDVSFVTFQGFFNDDYGVVPNAPIFTTTLLDQDSSLGATFDVVLLDSEKNVTSIVPAFNQYGSPFPTSQATRLWGVQTFTKPVVITPDTRNIDIGFSIKDGSMLGFGSYCIPSNPEPHCLEMGSIATFEFVVQVE